MVAKYPEIRWILPKQARSQRTLDRILDAAEVLVSEKGFDDASVAEVVERAGSSVGAFYSRFRDKDGLLYALHDRFLEQATATADDALEPGRWAGHSIPEILEVVLRFLVATYRQRRGLIRAFVLRNHSDPEFQARQEHLSHYVSTKLAALLLARRGQVGHENPERAVHFGLVMTLGAIESAVLFGDLRTRALTLSDEDLAVELTRAYLAYLGSRPASNPSR